MQHIINSAQTCLDCKKPKCQKGCPVNTPIAEMIRLFLAGDIKIAGEKIFENNPLSIICSLVCPHEKHCEGHCVLNKKYTPVNVGGIENYISTYYMNYKEFEKPKSNGHSIAIIGSGPAGISLAMILALKGYEITMYEGHDKIGGVLRYGIPDFRLDKSILDELLLKLKNIGVKIRPNTLIGKNITIDELFRDGYKAVFIGTGVWTPKKLGLKGESLGNVHFAIDYLKSPKAYNLGKKVVIVGAGNVAMDVARTAIRNGSREVSIMYRKGFEQMSAEKLEIEYAKIDGVKFNLYKLPLEFTPKGIKYLNTNEEKENIEGFEEADSILVSISQQPRDLIVSNTKGINVGGDGLVVTNENGETTREGVFASGDVVTGARTVVEAVALSKRVAIAIENYIANLKEQEAC
ncbi:NAD(P)-dependent oxidoreductase [Malaciobacter marinus]|uniref:Dihydropyrimidine dehydrogenase n=1 Tax=Malaciobacter marinus TaxID=505249 RepID=A0A347TGU6_9BACT|nr:MULTISPECIES: NAD(P)-dependent oxidoreductase [Malaciobacter]AXX85824.1 dihydropyrimidine dehydrogenase [Malaciobacter marinus]PHO11945.1 dihydropyrimidine dehydrogenase [Malaciobacter marinus]PHO15779.1 dihydropyrimidine dehydrogenase [Malaciobacter marinus]RYA23047.1 dihydropyrimidine dehydrogenase [Malaciobacter halophilus]